MQTYAKLQYLRQSPKKVRLVTQIIKGMQVKDAQSQLSFLRKRAARALLKLLNSVIANAKHNYNLKEDNLYIKEIRVDEGPALKRWMPRAFGRAASIRKKSSHITIVLDELTEEQKLKTEGKKVKGKEVKVEKARAKEKLEKPKVVKNLDEVKKYGKSKVKEEIKKQVRIQETKEYKKEPFDVRRKGKDREKQHLDQLKKKGKGGFLKRIFRRKSV